MVEILELSEEPEAVALLDLVALMESDQEMFLDLVVDFMLDLTEIHFPPEIKAEGWMD